MSCMSKIILESLNELLELAKTNLENNKRVKQDGAANLYFDAVQEELDEVKDELKKEHKELYK